MSKIGSALSRNKQSRRDAPTWTAWTSMASSPPRIAWISSSVGWSSRQF